MHKTRLQILLREQGGFSAVFWRLRQCVSYLNFVVKKNLNNSINLLQTISFHHATPLTPNNFHYNTCIWISSWPYLHQLWNQNCLCRNYIIIISWCNLLFLCSNEKHIYYARKQISMQHDDIVQSRKNHHQNEERHWNIKKGMRKKWCSCNCYNTVREKRMMLEKIHSSLKKIYILFMYRN